MTQKLLSENIQRIWGSIIVDEIAKNDITNFYLAPGMRNAPILASAFRNEEVKTYSFFDERALSYRALGRAKKSNTPSVISCTSGTAMANFLPAVIEAYKSNIPLIILTSDRPIELVKIDANQTINQTDMFKEFSCYTINLEAPSESLDPMRLRTLIATCCQRAKMYNRPVHINLPFREPLDSTIVKVSDSYLNKALESFSNTKSKNTIKQHNKISGHDPLFDKIKNAKSPLLVLGKIDRQNEAKHYIECLKEIDIPKYIDVTSGIKYQFSLAEGLNPSFDHPEVLEAYSRHKPDLIIHVGGRLVSKHYYSFQEKNRDVEIIHLTAFDDDHDPGFSNTSKIICDPLSFLEELKEFKLHTKAPINWIDFTNKKIKIIEDNEISFPFISKNVIELVKGPVDLLIGNSMAIRSFDSFISTHHNYPITVYSNRGVSGIEGFNATLCGLSDENETPIISVIGDVTFIHDLNSLLMLKDASNKNITIILVNNYGGGIFNLLPVAKEKDFLPLLTTPHHFKFKDLIKAFDYINYHEIHDKKSFTDCYQEAISRKGIDILEVFYDESVNHNVYSQLKTVKL